ncbi:MAG: AAA family ATPase, partial [Deltaproteobacteria bacterium]|nr:AAA family ATPase [Deltaproteobacteria bacterium]
MAYEEFFGLKDTPFRLTPDPEYYFPSDVHKEALQTLLYSIRAGEGFVQITGEPGTGKTLILRTIMRQLGSKVTTALILNPSLSPSELLRVILEDLGLDPLQTEEKPKEALLRYFRDTLLEKARHGIKTVIIIDEAQNLPNETMEELRLLSNLETEKEKLLQIILVGQVELEKKLRNPELKQLNQRITIRYRLKPLSKQDAIAYIYHRINVAGGGEHIRFSPRVLE